MNNEQIAVEVMGWHKSNFYPPTYFHDGEAIDVLPDFLNDHNAAMMVVEKMREDGWSIQISTNDVANNWNVKMESDDQFEIGEHYCDSLCHAICSAALKSKGETP